MLGIGSELNGDDAAGLLVARRLMEQVGAKDWLLVIEAGQAPENFSGVLRRFQADVVLLVDAAEMGESPGSIAWLDWREADGFGASTHTTSLALLAQFLTGELGCRVVLLGIQPASVQEGDPVSSAVRQAAHSIVAQMLLLA